MDLLFGIEPGLPASMRGKEATQLPRYYRGTSDPPVITGGTGGIPDSGPKNFMNFQFLIDRWWRVQMYPLRSSRMEVHVVSGYAPEGFNTSS